ncbi:hypothetical protein GCM10022222_23220 [Amycolatopsis ultiminotia]|uniref:TNT domain-containing protein n=1 Tax=Amycolatopsis ultiminotia TaxID=543629 RepID=A0ABP6VP21_9PSEU
MAQPTTQLNATEQDTLVKQIGLALLRAAPRDWRKVTAEYRAVGRYHELTGEIRTEDGTTQEWVATHDIATLFGRLRAGMYRDGRGTWFNARYQLDHPSSYNLEYNRDEPQWHLAPPPQAYSDELRMFPRTEENVPEWLIRRLSGLGPEQPGPHFRIARIFDSIGPAGRPVINRPDLDVDEQDRLLDYLDHAPVVVQDRGYDIDRLAPAPEATVPVAFHSDGQWIWPAAVNFYLRTYGVSPEADLVEHIRAAGFQLPQIDDLTLQGAAGYLTRGNQPPQQRPAPPRQAGPGGPAPAGPGGAPGQAGGPGAPAGAGGPGNAGPGAPGVPAGAGGAGPNGPGAPGSGGSGGPGPRLGAAAAVGGLAAAGVAGGVAAASADGRSGAAEAEPVAEPDDEATGGIDTVLSGGAPAGAEHEPDHEYDAHGTQLVDPAALDRSPDQHADYGAHHDDYADEHEVDEHRSAEPPFEQDFAQYETNGEQYRGQGAQYHEQEVYGDEFEDRFAVEEPYDDEPHAAFAQSGRNGTAPVPDVEQTALYSPVDEAPAASYEPAEELEHGEEPVLFTHGNEPELHDEEQRDALYTHSDRAPEPDDYAVEGHHDEPDFDAGPPTAMIMPGADVPGALPVDASFPARGAERPEPSAPPQQPSGGRRALREQPAEPALDDLQTKLAELNVPADSYRLGAATDRGWSVEQVDEGWRVGWYDGELVNPAVFGDAEDAAAFMLGKVLLHPEGHVPAEPEPAPEPEPVADPVADAPKPPVMATLSPEVATGSFPVRPRENVPPQEQTAFTPAEQLLADDEPPAQQAPPAPPTQVTPAVAALPHREPPAAPVPPAAAPVPPVQREEPARANGTRGGGGANQWPITPLSGEPPLTLFRGKELRELPAGSELDRFGGPNGNLTYAAGTPFEERSLVPEWVNRPYHVYRVQRPLETLAGVAIPWFNQPGGGAAYLLPASIEELVAEGDLIELDPGEPPID